MSKHSPQVNLQGFGINNNDQKFIIKELCRCCMGYIPKNLQICFNTPLSEVYFKVTAIQSDNNINFPNVVCPKCALQLEGMKSFIGKCEETDKKLKKLVEELEETLKIETVVKETTTNSNVETEVKEELKPVEEDISSELMVLRKVEENVDKDVWLPDNEDFDNDPNLQEPIEAKKKRLKASKSKTKPSKEGKYKNTCATCGIKFESLELLEKHYQDNNTCKPARFYCKICNKPEPHLSKLRRHEDTHKEHLKKSNLNCLTCGTWYRSYSLLAEHCKKKGCQLRVIKCKVCNKVFEKPSRLSRHMAVHNNEEWLPCTLCKKMFNCEDALKRHIKRHGDGNRTTCEICGKVLKSRISLTNHLSRVHPTEPLPTTPTLKCPLCPKLYTTPLKLKEHTLRVHKKKDLLCSYCGKAFNSKSFLTEHVRTHTGEKPFACELCPKSFRILSQRTVHMNTHTGNKPFGCDVCSMSFKVATHLIQHKRIHTGERPYECSFCEKKFALVGTWRVHERIHTGELPYPCSTCGKAFKSSSARTKHMQTHGIFYDREKTEKVEASISKDSAIYTNNVNQVSS